MIRSFLYSWRKYFPLDASSRICILGVRIVTFVVIGIGTYHILFSIFLFSNSHWVKSDTFSPFFLSSDFPSTGLISGFALLILAIGLSRKKKASWFLGLILFLFIALSRFIYQGDYLQTTLALTMALWLFVSRPKFIVLSGWPSSKQVIRITIIASFFALSVGLLFFIYSIVEKYSGVNIQFFSFALEIESGSEFVNGLILSFYIFSAIIGGYVLHTSLQPIRPEKKRTQAEFLRACSIVEKYGKSSYAYLTLLDDKIHYFSPGGSLVAFTVKGRVAVVLGDPIGPSEDITSAICDFREFCTRNDWLPAFCFTLPDYLTHYQKVGFEVLCMGHEGIINLDKFVLSGRSRANFRKRYKRMNRLGFQLIIHVPPISRSMLSELREISDEWLAMKKRKEKHFFLGHFDEEYIRNGLIATVSTPDGDISAYVNLVPEFQRNEISIDLMRRREDILSGTMDFLFVSLFIWAKNHGYDTFNLGLCALSGVGEKSSDSSAERILNLIYEYGNRIYDFKGLYRFKDKFKPYWIPQYLIYPKLVYLPAVWIAMARVNSAQKGPSPSVVNDYDDINRKINLLNTESDNFVG